MNPLIHEDTARVCYPAIPGIAEKFLECRNGWAVVVDVRAAFRNLAVCREDLHFCGFRDTEGRFFVDTRVSFGGRTGPGLYDILGQLLQWVVVNHLAKWCPGLVSERLLDDSCFVFETKEQAMRGLAEIKAICFRLHVELAADKFQVSQQPLFLGFVWDLVRQLLSLPLPKLEKLDAHLAVWGKLELGQEARLLDLMKFVGFLEHTAMVLVVGRPFMRALQRATAGFGQGVTRRQAHFLRVKISAAMREEILFWAGLRAGSRGCPLVPHLHFLLVRCRRAAISPRLLGMIPVSHMIGTDASPSGFGGMCRGRHYFGAWSPGPGGQQLLTAPGSSTVFTEFLSVLFGVRLYGASFAGSLLRVFCDNAGVVQDWLTQSSPSSPAAQAVIRALARELAVCAVYLVIVWIPTEANVFPDYLSRQGELAGSKPQLDACMGAALRDNIQEAWLEEAWSMLGAPGPA